MEWRWVCERGGEHGGKLKWDAVPFRAGTSPSCTAGEARLPITPTDASLTEDPACDNARCDPTDASVRSTPREHCSVIPPAIAHEGEQQALRPACLVQMPVPGAWCIAHGACCRVAVPLGVLRRPELRVCRLRMISSVYHALCIVTVVLHTQNQTNDDMLAPRHDVLPFGLRCCTSCAPHGLYHRAGQALFPLCLPRLLYS